MPVSVKPFRNRQLWCDLVRNTQEFWQHLNTDPVLSQTVRMTRTLVFYDNPAPGGSTPEDKSGIRQVNELCHPPIYPESHFKDDFYGRVLTACTNIFGITPGQSLSMPAATVPVKSLAANRLARSEVSWFN